MGGWLADGLRYETRPGQGQGEGEGERHGRAGGSFARR